MKGNARQSFGSDKSIPGSQNDPVYQTQRIGLDGFNFDVPDGEYEVSLHFAELEAPIHQETIVYNLGIQTTVAPFSPRSFNVLINGLEVIHDLSNNSELKPFAVHVSGFRINVTNGQGIKIHFQDVKGEAILNGIQVKKIL
jgi:beta-galactosidase